MQRFWIYVLIALILAGLVAIGLFSGRFVVYLAMRVLILSIFALGYNLILGRTGLLSFGHAAFYAGGAYGLGLFSIHVSANPLLGIIVGVALACIMALVIGFFCVRHTEIYFAMLTLAFGMMVFSLIWNLREITGGGNYACALVFRLCEYSIDQDKPLLFFCPRVLRPECRNYLFDPAISLWPDFIRDPRK